MKKNIFILIFCLLPSLLLASGTLNFSNSTESSAASSFALPILTEAYKRLGIEFTVTKYPAKRSLISANLGKSDGEIHRISGLQKEFPNLIEIKVPIVKLEWMLYSKNYNFKVEGIKSIKPYSISTRRGIIFAERIVSKAKNHLLVNGWMQVLATLEHERVDLALIPKIAASKILQKNPMRIYALMPPFQEFYLYHYLHKKNQNLIPKITKVLKEMEKSGEITDIWNQIEKNLIK